MADPKVLIVDDEEQFRSTLVKRLSKRSMLAGQAGSGEEALDVLSRDLVEVVVLDMKMPGMGGLAALKEIKRIHPLVEVIILTAHADLEAAVQGMELGAFDYLLKPMEIDELVFKIQDACERRSIQLNKIRTMRERNGDAVLAADPNAA